MTILDGLPTLSFGAHSKGDGRACVMQYVSVITGDDFTDSPSCTCETIREIAINVNDAYGENDDQRARDLVPLIPRIAGANHEYRDFPNFVNDFEAWKMKTLGASDRKCCYDPHCGVVLTEFANDVSQYSVEWLTMVLDWYEEYTGRTETTVTMDDVTRAAELIGAL